ncbi:hypothetical protein ACFW5V_32215 [Streptomyces sp. NPDC058762]|uniref:hypothetical protein n=1 Tax=Streptomyces sp. NPDC058762 TaxID=3346629 RepID=UPI0036747CCE
MSSSHTEKLDIIVGDFPTHAALYNIKGVRTLFMSSDQTFSRAVENVRNVLPGITLEAAERMIREQCPEFKDLDDLLGRNIPTLPSVERPAPEPVDDVAKEQLPSKRRRKVVLVAALLPALAASWALGRYTNVADTTPADNAKTAATSPDTAGNDHGKAPFEEPRFTRFAGASNIDCDPISPLEAECTDADGKVMSTKAATGPDSTLFTFSYGSERIGLRIFYDADYAATWARQDGTKDLYPNLEMHGRYALWGTDPARVKDYSDLLAESDTGDVQAMGGATSLPPRLAALTLGTLGLDQGEVHQLLAQTPTPVPADTPAIMAARLVLGLDQVPPTPALPAVPDGEDIVAIAAGIEPAPSTGGKTVPVTEPSGSGSTAPAGDTAGTGSGTTQPATRPATQPSTDAETSTGSGEATEPSTPPAETKPPETTAPPATTPPPTTTPPTTPPATEPPADTAPSDAAESTDPTAPTEPTDPAPADTVEPESPTEPAPTEPPAEETPVEERPEPPAEDTPPGTDETPAPPAEEAPDPAQETPAPVETPAEEAGPPPGRTPGESGDDLLILNSAWTVAAA